MNEDNTGEPSFPQAPPDGIDTYEDRAAALIRSQRTMVLGTCTADEPWTAPVYYVYSPPGFYFFSSPKARHILQGLESTAAAASIFVESGRWEEIQGLQMSGTIKVVSGRRRQLTVIARYLLKFPFARPFLQSGGERRNEPHLGDSVRIYVFVPRQAYYLDNRLGFGKRMPVSLVA
jgi:uncharacterized protein